MWSGTDATKLDSKQLNVMWQPVWLKSQIYISVCLKYLIVNNPLSII